MSGQVIYSVRGGLNEVYISRLYLADRKCQFPPFPSNSDVEF